MDNDVKSSSGANKKSSVTEKTPVTGETVKATSTQDLDAKSEEQPTTNGLVDSAISTPGDDKIQAPSITANPTSSATTSSEVKPNSTKDDATSTKSETLTDSVGDKGSSQPQPVIQQSDTLILDTTDNLDGYLGKAHKSKAAKIKESETVVAKGDTSETGKSDTATEQNTSEINKMDTTNATDCKSNENIGSKNSENSDTNRASKTRDSDDNDGGKNGSEDKTTNKKQLPSRVVWVSNISRETRASDLKVALSKYGKVSTARIVTDGKGYYGYILMERHQEAKKGIEKLHDTVFKGSKIQVSCKRPNATSENKGSNKKPADKTVERKDKSNKDTHSFDKIKNDERKPGNLEKKRDIIQTGASKGSDSKRLRVKNLNEIRREKELIRKRREQAQLRVEREESRKRQEREEKLKMERELDKERRRLEFQREQIEKEKLDLIRLQKKLADSERMLITRQKMEIKNNLRKFEEEQRRRHRSPDDYERRPKIPRTEGVPRRDERRTDASAVGERYWKNERKSLTRIYSDEYKKSGRDIPSPPPPPVLLPPRDESSRKGDKGHTWSSYKRKEYASHIEKKEEPRSSFIYQHRRESLADKTYSGTYSRDQHYKSSKDVPPKYEKMPMPVPSPWQGSQQPQYSKDHAWNDSQRSSSRHQDVSSFPNMSVPNIFYPPPLNYSRGQDSYRRQPERKY